MERKGFCFPCLDYKNGQGKKEKGKKGGIRRVYFNSSSFHQKMKENGRKGKVFYDNVKNPIRNGILAFLFLFFSFLLIIIQTTIITITFFSFSSLSFPH